MTADFDMVRLTEEELRQITGGAVNPYSLTADSVCIGDGVIANIIEPGETDYTYCFPR